jgi:hypothetical protein
VEQRFPAGVIGLHAETAAAQGFGDAHLVVAGFGGGHAHFADQFDHLRRDPAIVGIFAAAVFQQVAVLLVARQHLLAREGLQALDDVSHLVGQFECDSGQVFLPRTSCSRSHSGRRSGPG